MWTAERYQLLNTLGCVPMVYAQNTLIDPRSQRPRPAEIHPRELLQRLCRRDPAGRMGAAERPRAGPL